MQIVFRLLRKVRMWGAASLLAEPTFNIVFSLLLFGRQEDGFTRGGFNQLSLQQKGREIGYPGGLLDGMRGKNDGVLLF